MSARAGEPPRPGEVRGKAERAIERVLSSERDTRAIFVEFSPERILAEADAIDARHEAGEHLPLHGLLVSLKDLIDEAGQRTTAGSRLLAEREPAAGDAEIVRRLRAAGALPFGRTSMSEFAYSGVGLNPHHGTPGNVFDEARVPGGSSSGGALSVALGFCDVAIGTDTGGSVRIPAAANGLVGYKPTQASVPRDGVHALSDTFDSVGPLAADLVTTLRCHEVAVRRADGTLHRGRRCPIVRCVSRCHAGRSWTLSTPPSPWRSRRRWSGFAPRATTSRRSTCPASPRPPRRCASSFPARR